MQQIEHIVLATDRDLERKPGNELGVYRMPTARWVPAAFSAEVRPMTSPSRPPALRRHTTGHSAITERLRKIAELIDRGELKTHVGAVLPLAYARDAHMMLEGRRPTPRGKIILNVEAAGEVTSAA